MRTCRLWPVVAVAAASLLGFVTPAEAQWGSIKGKVVLDGDVPTLKPLVKMGDAAAKDAAVCAAQEVPDESAVIDPSTKGIANVVVYLRKAPSKINPALAKPASDVVVYDQKGCRFIPHVAIVQTSQTVQVISEDAIAHNTRGNPIKNNGFNFIVAPNDRMGIKVPMKLAETLPVGIGCDIHPWMKGWWVVVDHPYAAVTDKDGTFEIKDLPAGEHEFRVWQERMGYVEKSLKVTVKDKATTEVPTIKVPVKSLLAN
uniref:Rhamnogalacturonan lyase domain-containing protein n=1 Tax=Schlesneria paludicola TaxID=360056 RepID=A0A7C2JYP3_9PLAN